MPRHLVTINIPLELDYTSLKKDAVCKVYFSDNTPSRIECYIDGRHFTPKSVNDDLAIVAKARAVYKQGQYSIVSAEVETDIREKNNKVYSDTVVKDSVPRKKDLSKPSQALEPKNPLDLDPSKYAETCNKLGLQSVEFKSDSKFDVVKEFLEKNNGKVTVKDIVEKTHISEYIVKTSLTKLKVIRIRDMNYKWKGRRYFVSLPFKVA